jgi:hypothetical protein
MISMMGILRTGSNKKCLGLSGDRMIEPNVPLVV